MRYLLSIYALPSTSEIVLFKNLNHFMRQILLYSINLIHFADEETEASRGEITHTSTHLVRGRASI